MSWQQSMVVKAKLELTNYIYKTEGTLFQVAFDKNFRPELYRLKTEEPRRNDSHKRYNELMKKFTSIQNKD